CSHQDVLYRKAPAGACSLVDRGGVESGSYIQCQGRKYASALTRIIPTLFAPAISVSDSAPPVVVHVAPHEGIPKIAPIDAKLSLDPAIDGIANLAPKVELHEHVNVPAIVAQSGSIVFESEDLGWSFSKHVSIGATVADVIVEVKPRGGFPETDALARLSSATPALDGMAHPAGVDLRPVAADRPHVAMAIICIFAAILGAILYHRIRAGEVLEHPLRRQILDAIQAQGHCNATALAAEFGVHWTAVGYHARVLEREGLLRRVRCGRVTLLVPFHRWAKTGLADGSPAARAVLEAFRAEPGKPLSHYARVLGCSVPNVFYHRKRLVATGELSAEGLPR
ncbi:MAG TPA: helix-turn-helix transcriptional regulator, partial [Burkholderiales bacterium]|nr:helix-turn-helix transcriptional regulator [Burkholderiales bacterium]